MWLATVIMAFSNFSPINGSALYFAPAATKTALTCISIPFSPALAVLTNGGIRVVNVLKVTPASTAGSSPRIAPTFLTASTKEIARLFVASNAATTAPFIAVNEPFATATSAMPIFLAAAHLDPAAAMARARATLNAARRMITASLAFLAASPAMALAASFASENATTMSLMRSKALSLAA